VKTLDSGFRRNDEKDYFSVFCETVNKEWGWFWKLIGHLEISSKH